MLVFFYPRHRLGAAARNRRGKSEKFRMAGVDDLIWVESRGDWYGALLVDSSGGSISLL